MSSNIKLKKPMIRQWYWFAGLYFAGIVVYGAVEITLHYLNVFLTNL